MDFGVGNKLTLTNGMAIDFEVVESRRLKRLQRELARKAPKSKNREHLRHALRREYERLNNRRWDAQVTGGARTLGASRSPQTTARFPSG
ncbi:hypothetical protein Thermus77412_24480 [Thermus antranikianii]